MKRLFAWLMQPPQTLLGEAVALAIISITIFIGFGGFSV